MLVVLLILLVDFFSSRQSLSAPSIPDLSSLIPSGLGNAFVQTVGLNMDHRSYQPATALGMSLGLDVGLETTLVQPPASLSSALGSLGSMGGAGSPSSSASSSSPTIPIIPSIRLHIHKGISKKIDIGFSALPTMPSWPYVGGTLLMGGDIKVVIWEPEEGATWALRGSYNVNNLNINYTGYAISVQTATITPQLLISKKLSFADPYLGLGYQYTYGSLQLTVPVPSLSPPLPSIAPIVVTQSGSGAGTFFFGGISMKVPLIGLKFTIEGAYSPLGMNYLGTKIGFEM